MIIIGACMLPVFLLSGTAISEFVTKTAQSVGAFPAGISQSAFITHSTLEGPVEKFIAITLGKFTGNMNLQTGLVFAVSIILYLLIFIWYAKQMKKRNKEYLEKMGK